MKIIRLTQGVALAVIFSLTACMPANYPTYIVGKWKPLQLNVSESQRYAFVPDTGGSELTEENRQVLDQMKQELSKLREEGVTVQDIKEKMKAAMQETQVTYIFTSQGEATREVLGGESINGTWQLKKRGKLLILTCPDKEEPFRLSIDSLSAKRMVVHNPNLPRGMRLTYIKK